MSGGIMGNSDSPSSHFNGPVTFDDRDDGQMNQVWAALERTTDLSKNCGWFVGGRVDFMWGSDFFFTTAAGLDGTPVGNVPRWNTTDSQLYGFAMPQLYAETDYDDLRIKWGHFFTIIGYEVVPDIGNFFYSHSYTMQYGEPFTHTGMLASRNINDNWSWSAGIVSGWNEFDLTGGVQFLGGITYTDKDYGSLAFSIITGNDSTVNLPGVGPNANRTMYSLVWSRTLTSRWTYVLQHDLGIQQDAATLQGTDTAEWYGINQYLFYKMNCCWTAGVRFEWFRDDDGFNVTGLRPGNPLVGNFFAGDFYELTLGANYKPNGNWNIRPEIRYDWFNPTSSSIGSQNPYDNNNSKRQFLFGLDAIYQF
jgi:Putative beta-barrel porin-2, OmpL-like. bbp2